MISALALWMVMWAQGHTVASAQTFELQPTPGFNDRNPFEIRYSQKAPSSHNFWILTGITAGVTILDLHQTITCGGVEVGSPWLYGSLPYRHPARVSAIMIGEVGISSLLGWKMRKNHVKYWWVPQVGLTISHGRGVVHNLRQGIY